MCPPPPNPNLDLEHSSFHKQSFPKERSSTVALSVSHPRICLTERVKRFLALLSLLALAGCEQTRPPTPQGLKLIAARTAKGTVNTKLETKTQPDPPRAGQISIWDLKVFDIHDKPDKTRTEWKFFNALPQESTENATTGVQMKAWLISKDRSVFLPQKPNYKQYGSFVTDWTIPKSGFYTLWVEYQPVVAKDELSLQDLKKAPPLPIERAHWNVSVAGTSTVNRPVAPSEHGGAFGTYSLDSNDYAHGAGMDVTFKSTKAKVGQKIMLHPQINGAQDTITEQSFTALSPDSNTLLHEVGPNAGLTFSQKGKWRVWFVYSVNDVPYVCPIDIDVT